MNTLTLSLLCACAMMSLVAKATPVYPVLHLKHYSPVDVCLFICNICFENMDEQMMNCANHVCLAQQKYDMNLGLLRIGRTCKDLDKLDAYIFNEGNETQ